MAAVGVFDFMQAWWYLVQDGEDSQLEAGIFGFSLFFFAYFDTQASSVKGVFGPSKRPKLSSFFPLEEGLTTN